MGKYFFSVTVASVYDLSEFLTWVQRWWWCLGFLFSPEEIELTAECSSL